MNLGGLFMSRKAFNFFNSYFVVAKELSDKDRLAFYDALITAQFTGQILPLKGMAFFAYKSQEHSIMSQLNGYNQRLKSEKAEGVPIKITHLKPIDYLSEAGGGAGGEAQGEGQGEGQVQYVMSVFSFEDFWTIYPHKIAKSKCEPKYNKLSESERQKIKDTLPNFLKYKPFKSYVHPNPEAYLNQKRWEDELPTVAKAKSFEGNKSADEMTDEERSYYGL